MATIAGQHPIPQSIHTQGFTTPIHSPHTQMPSDSALKEHLQSQMLLQMRRLMPDSSLSLSLSLAHQRPNQRSHGSRSLSDKRCERNIVGSRGTSTLQSVSIFPLTLSLTFTPFSPSASSLPHTPQLLLHMMFQEPIGRVMTSSFTSQ